MVFAAHQKLVLKYQLPQRKLWLGHAILESDIERTDEKCLSA